MAGGKQRPAPTSALQVDLEEGLQADSAAAVASGHQSLGELGGGGPMPEDRQGVLGRVQAMAEALMQKSEKPLTSEQAVAAIFRANPKLYDEYCRQ